MPVRSRSRPAVSGLYSSNSASGPVKSNRLGCPGRRWRSSRRAKSQTMAQSGRASPGAGTARRTWLMRRSELVTVPSFSPQLAAGSSRSAWRQVSVVKKASWTTTKGQAASAACTRCWSGRDWAGLVQAIHRALMRPSATASNRSMADSPGVSGKRSTPNGPPLRRGVRHRPPRDGRAAGSPGCRLAATHGVGLAGEGEGPGTRPADLPGGQVQVDQRAVLGAAGARLVQAHAPEREEARRAADPLGAAQQIGGIDSA